MQRLARSWAICVKVVNFLLENESTIKDLKASCESSSGHQLLSFTKIYPSRSGFTNVSKESCMISSACDTWSLLTFSACSIVSLFWPGLWAFLLMASCSYCLITACFFRTFLDKAFFSYCPKADSNENFFVELSILESLVLIFKGKSSSKDS